LSLKKIEKTIVDEIYERRETEHAQKILPGTEQAGENIEYDVNTAKLKDPENGLYKCGFKLG